ncbi:MFS transporter [Bacillus sp. 03113]|uniref:MFS transporter n=1 Tax=Bacillus sp. 03113 TaxID=2578211 RepID=UPI0011427E99|nr:MFS transporter [Bacillus sp. 03113]
MVGNNHKSFWTIIAAGLGYFMALLDTTIVNVSLPKITEYYGTTMDQISWIVDAYNLTFGIVLLTAVRLADQFGRKKLFQIGLVLFTVSSLLCGFSQTVEILIVFRTLQGLAAAIIVPVSVPMVIVQMSSEKVGSVTALFGLMAGVAAALGPTLGGILSENFSWQWIFWINIPIGVLAILLVKSIIRESYDPTASKSIDWGGIITLSVSLFSLIYGLLQIKESGGTSTIVLICFGSTIVAGILFIFFEKKSRQPMLPLYLFKNLAFTSGNFATVFLGIGMMSVYFLMAFYLTTVNEMSQMHAGLVLSSASIATMLITPIASKAYKWGTKWLGVIGFILFGIGAYLLGNIPLDSSIWVRVGNLMVVGIGSGLIFSPLSISLIMQVPVEKAGISSGLFQASRAIGTAVGVAILVLLLQHTIQDEWKLAKHEVIVKIEKSTLTEESKQQMIHKINDIKDISHQQPSKSMSLKDILARIDKQEKKTLQTSPQGMHDEIKMGFFNDKKEMKQLFPKLEDTIKNHLSSAFSSVFHLGSISLFIGMIFAYFNGITANEMKQEISKRNFSVGVEQ